MPVDWELGERPGDELVPWIDYFWTVTWDRGDAEPLLGLPALKRPRKAAA